MNEMNENELKEILDKHMKWLRGEPGGSRANLSCANLYGADLSCANLSRADLYGANLSCANLYGANLSCANLYGANLYGANLSRANLSCANLSRADLYGANLSCANLSCANLYGANMSRANLSCANLYGADLSCANLSRADLYGAKIETSLLNKFYPIACPESGAFVGWKKARNNLIVKLEICDDAKRSSAFTRKCRCSKATVLAIENIDGTEANVSEIESGRDRNFVYKIGETVCVPDFDEDRRNECSTGIHFFITRQEAVDYIF